MESKMVFSSVVFLSAFLPAALGLSWLLRRHLRINLGINRGLTLRNSLRLTLGYVTGLKLIIRIETIHIIAFLHFSENLLYN